MPEIVGTFLRTELRDEGADGAVKAWDGSRCHFTQECLEFAVRHLDGIEVGRIFRQVTQCRAHCFDSPANAGPQMDPAVIHHDDVVASERRNPAAAERSSTSRQAWRSLPRPSTEFMAAQSLL